VQAVRPAGLSGIIQQTALKSKRSPGCGSLKLPAMWQAIREIIDRLRQREPIIWVACAVLLALIASAWLVGTLQRFFGQ